MIIENLDKINKNVLDKLKLYERNFLNEITINSYKYSSERIELIKEIIIEKNKDAEKIKQDILDVNNILLTKNMFHNFELIKDISRLELEVNKFWYKFNFKLNSKNKEKINFWKNEYLESYKKIFFQNKKSFDINEINNNCYESKKIKTEIKFSSLKI